jgi:hypothetical protein
MSESRDYEVGYGRPPRASQFQKGQSGNPAGRPKSSKSMSDRIRDQLNTSITALNDGQRIVVTKQQAIIRQLIKRALAGDAQAAEILLRQARANEPSQGREIIFQGDEKWWSMTRGHWGEGMYSEGDDGKPLVWGETTTDATK